jgi:glutathione synthase/RimK-type ligase-like ATP-grasp enzyme
MILVVSHPGDDHARGVLATLSRRGHDAILVDTAEFPANATLTQRFGVGGPAYELALSGCVVDLTRCGVGWWRRPRPFTLEDGLAANVVSFTYSECHEAMAGLWASLDLAWINPPGLDEIAHHKPYQLKIAAEVGLPVPRTVITNNPAAVQEFVDELGPERIVYKTFLATEDCWRETRLLRPEELTKLASVRFAPVIFQEYIAASDDIRVTLIGDRLFATSIRPAVGGYEVDYRMDLAGATFRPAELPRETEQAVHTLMKRLGLVYGAIDLRRTEAGQYVFLEVNPAGEWLFVEERTGQPITQTMTEVLIEFDRD